MYQLLFEDPLKVACMFFTYVPDFKVIDYKDKGDRSVFMAEESRYALGLVVAMFGKVDQSVI